MFNPRANLKRDPLQRWQQPDRRFFACGACHVLAHEFLQHPAGHGFTAYWIRPAAGFTGNHVFASDGVHSFDYHGFHEARTLLAHHVRRGARAQPGWHGTVTALDPRELLGAGTREGLHLRPPSEFLQDPRPRARRFVTHHLARRRDPRRRTRAYSTRAASTAAPTWTGEIGVHGA